VTTRPTHMPGITIKCSSFIKFIYTNFPADIINTHYTETNV